MQSTEKALQIISHITNIVRYYPYRFSLIYNRTLQNYLVEYNNTKNAGLNLQAVSSLVSKKGLITPFHFKNGYLLCPVFSNLNFSLDDKNLQTITVLSHSGETHLPYLTNLGGQATITYLETMNPIVSKIHSLWFSLTQQAAYDSYANLDIPYGHIFIFTTTPDIRSPLVGISLLGAIPLNDPVVGTLQGNIADNTLVEIQVTYAYRTYRRFYISDKLIEDIYSIPSDADYRSIQPLRQLIDTFLLTDDVFWADAFSE